MSDDLTSTIIKKTITAKITGYKDMDLTKEPLTILRVKGIVQRVELGETNYGVYQKLLGNFQYLCITTGEMGVSMSFIPPSNFGEYVPQDSEALPIEIDWIIGSTPDDTNAFGYRWTLQVVSTAPIDFSALLELPSIEVGTKKAKAIKA